MRRSEVLLKWVHGPDVLDVGCTDHTVKEGRPEWVHGRLREQFPDAWGIDMEQTNLARMREAGYSNLVLADAQSFDLRKQFDTIVAGELIEHLENPAGFLASSKRHLKPGGSIVITTPYPFGLLNILYAWLRYPKTCSNPQHSLWLCPATLHVLAERAGLRVEHWQLLTDTPPSESARWNALTRLVRWLPLPGLIKHNDMLFVLTRLQVEGILAADSAP